MWARQTLLSLPDVTSLSSLSSLFTSETLERELSRLSSLPRVAVDLPAALIAPDGGNAPSSLLDYGRFVEGGAASGTASVRIINGVDVNVGAEGAVPYPWYVQLRRRVSGTSYMLCGGSIVHAWQRGEGGTDTPAGFWVVSAAHCLTDPAAAYTVNIYVGGQQAGEPIRNVGAFPVDGDANAPGWMELPPELVTVFAHPGYDGTSHHRDVALLRCVMPANAPLPAPLTRSLGGEVNWSAVSRLPVSQSLPSSAAIIGFGATSAGGSVAHVLQYGAVRVEDASVRQEITSHPSYVSTLNTWATGPVNAAGEAVDTCQGDSGGPLFSFELEQVGEGVVKRSADMNPPNSPSPSQLRTGGLREVHTVHAVTSWGISCGMPRYPGVYAKLAPFVAPPSVDDASRLSPSSPWQLGMVGMISSLSPSPYRGLTVESVQLPEDVANGVYVADDCPYGGCDHPGSGGISGDVLLWGGVAAAVIMLLVISFVAAKLQTAQEKRRARPTKLRIRAQTKLRIRA